MIFKTRQSAKKQVTIASLQAWCWGHGKEPRDIRRKKNQQDLLSDQERWAEDTEIRIGW